MRRTIINPIIQSDVPDPDVIRVGNRFYMTSTTMHFTPGVPIMRSTDGAHWEIVSYVYDVLENGDPQSLRNGRNMYGKGAWAACLRFHEGTFYVCFASYDAHRTYVYKTRDIENGPWSRSMIESVCHDPSLLFDNDGRIYMAYGSGNIRLREMTRDVSAFLAGGADVVVVTVPPEGMHVPAEGSHLYHLNGFYYLFLIQWPAGESGRRIQWCYRSRNVLGPYEGKIVLDDDLGYRNRGVAQGGIFDTGAGRWLAMLFQDHGALGRVPVLIPVRWVDGWPVLGRRGKAPRTMRLEADASAVHAIVTDDEFDRPQNRLPPQWQWNHNPDNRLWSLTVRPGFLRLTTAETARHLLEAKNTLTQRTVGPACYGETALSVVGLRPGDRAGLAAFQNGYGFIGVAASEDLEKRIVTAANRGDGHPAESGSITLTQDTVYLRIVFDFTDERDEASFFYSLDGTVWRPLGDVLAMRYTLDHFTGYRIALFYYATSTPGGYADFDYFRLRNTSAGFIRTHRSTPQQGLPLRRKSHGRRDKNSSTAVSFS